MLHYWEVWVWVTGWSGLGSGLVLGIRDWGRAEGFCSILGGRSVHELGLVSVRRFEDHSIRIIDRGESRRPESLVSRLVSKEEAFS